MDLIDILLAKRLVGKELPPAIINLKGVVPTHFELPLSGNAKGDVWVVSVDNSEWIWMSDNSSGTISDYDIVGVVVDLRPYRTAADQDVIDSGKQAKITASGMLKGDGNGGVTPAEAGTDYGTYSKPANGIPASDMESAVQTSLDKADTALQSSALSPYRTSADQDTIDEHKAEVDGYYSEMTVGDAEQLVATVGLTEKVPYNFRTAGGSADIGDREVDKIVGGTVAWNQMVKIPVADTSLSQNGVTITDNRDGSYTVFTDENGATDNVYQQLTTIGGKLGHKYLYKSLQKSGSSSTFYSYLVVHVEPVPSKDFGNGAIYNCTETGNVNVIIIYVKQGTVITTPIKCIPQIFDLTAMFGSTIADYIYTLETNNAGAGVAWFRNLFPKDYYAYNAGELMSVQTSAHVMTGFNQWDEEWELGGLVNATGAEYSANDRIRSKNYSPCLPSTTYYGKAPTTYLKLYWYDAEQNYIGYADASNTTVTSPSDAHYFRLVLESATTYNHDICINLHWDGERDGEYEAYSEHNYPLDASLELRGIPKLNSSNKLYYDGDVYESSGEVTRKYGIVDLGSLDWRLNVGTQYYANFTNAKPKTENAIVSNGRYTVSANGGYNYFNMHISLYGMNIWLCDSSYSTAESLKTALSGVYLVYELATPTTESAEAYRNPQVVDNFGTEEYVDAAVTATTPTRDVAIPVGHNSFYKQDLRAKLEMVPNPPDSNGDYLMRHTNGENSYVAYTSPIPAVTSVDDGKFARVVNGAWAAVTIPEAAGEVF